MPIPPATESQISLARELGVNIDPEQCNIQEASRIIKRLIDKKKREERLDHLEQFNITIGSSVGYVYDRNPDRIYVVARINDDGTVTLNGRGGAFDPCNLNPITQSG